MEGRSIFPPVCVVLRSGADIASQCFKDSNEHLNVSYSVTPAFG